MRTGQVHVHRTPEGRGPWRGRSWSGKPICNFKCFWIQKYWKCSCSGVEIGNFSAELGLIHTDRYKPHWSNESHPQGLSFDYILCAGTTGLTDWHDTQTALRFPVSFPPPNSRREIPYHFILPSLRFSLEAGGIPRLALAFLKGLGPKAAAPPRDGLQSCRGKGWTLLAWGVCVCICACVCACVWCCVDYLPPVRQESVTRCLLGLPYLPSGKQ